MPTLILLIVTFIALSGLMAMVDAAVLSVSRAETEEMVRQHKYGAKALRLIKQRITRAVVIIVVLTNVINVLGPILVGHYATALYGSTSLGIITAVLTFGTIIFSEIIPKSLGSHYAPQISRFVAPWLQGCIIIAYPLILALERLVNLFKSGKRHIGTEEQIRSLAQLGHQEGLIEDDEHQLIDQAFLLNDNTAEQIMKPSDQIVSIPASATLRDAAEVVFEHDYSRYPVVADDQQTITGVIMSTDVLQALTRGEDTTVTADLARPALFINHDMRADDLLRLFRTRRNHLAIVQKIDQVIGLVTLEDVLEELVGEIEDEKDGDHQNAEFGIQNLE